MQIHPDRIRFLNSRPLKKGAYGVYWMQQSQRVEFNHALAHAILEANRLRVSLIVLFVVAPHFPEANLRSYSFMLEGLQEVASSLEKQGREKA